MTYVLHYAPDNASLIVRLAMEQCGLPYRTVLVDRSTRAQDTPAYKKLNPAGLIPTLETPHGPLFETGAILLWLNDTHGHLGPGPQDHDRGDFLKWLFFLSNTLHPALRMMFYPEKYIGDLPSDQDALRQGLARSAKNALGLLERHAQTRPEWLGAAHPSALDFYLVCCLRWCALYPSDVDRSWFNLDDFPTLQSICKGLETLPCVAAALTAEGLGPTPFSAPRKPTPPEGSAT